MRCTSYAVWNTYEKMAYVRMVVNRQASEIDLKTSPATYSSALYGNPCQHVETVLMCSGVVIGEGVMGRSPRAALLRVVKNYVV